MGRRRIFSGGILLVKGDCAREGLEENVLATKLQGAIADEGARQQAGLAEDLEAVANAQHRPALGGEVMHRPHDGAEPRNGPGAQVVPVTEAAGNDDGVKARQRVFLVPDQAAGQAEHVLDDVQGVLVAIGGGELEDGDIHVIGSRSGNLR